MAYRKGLNPVIGYRDVLVDDVFLNNKETINFLSDYDVLLHRNEEYFTQYLNLNDVQSVGGLTQFMANELDGLRKQETSLHACEIINGQSVGVLKAITAFHVYNMFFTRLDNFIQKNTFDSIDNKVINTIQEAIYKRLEDGRFEPHVDMSSLHPCLDIDTLRSAMDQVEDKEALYRSLSSMSLDNLYEIKMLIQEHQYGQEKMISPNDAEKEKNTIFWNIREKYIAPGRMDKTEATAMVGRAYYNQAITLQKQPYQNNSPRYAFDIYHVISLQDEFERNAFLLLSEEKNGKRYLKNYTPHNETYNFKETFFNKLSQEKQKSLRQYFARTLSEIIGDETSINLKEYYPFPVKIPE